MVWPEFAALANRVMRIERRLKPVFRSYALDVAWDVDDFQETAVVVTDQPEPSDEHTCVIQIPPGTRRRYFLAGRNGEVIDMEAIEPTDEWLRLWLEAAETAIEDQHLYPLGVAARLHWPTTIRALQAARARVAELEERLVQAASYRGIEAFPCPLCEYRDGVFIKSCEMHRQLEASARRIAELEADIEHLLSAQDARRQTN